MNVERFLYGELGLTPVDEDKLRSKKAGFMSVTRKDIFSVHAWLWSGLGLFFGATAFSDHSRLIALPAIGAVALLIILVLSLIHI